MHPDHRKTVLIVDDDADLRRVLVDGLTHRGYRAIEARHGAEGVHLARQHLPDLILLDIRTPVMDGWAALDYLKTYDRTAGIEVWGVSGHLMDSGGTDLRHKLGRVVSKPFEIAVLLDAIDDFLASVRT
jgi:CheY-like chemotaxis protein